jgi:hypothetical protein
LYDVGPTLLLKEQYKKAQERNTQLQSEELKAVHVSTFLNDGEKDINKALELEAKRLAQALFPL